MEPISLDSLFKAKIFRIPDYQRGYSWQEKQLKEFWEDLINLTGDRSHYFGLLTLKLINDIPQNSRKFWLVDDHSYHVYHIVDGQQRLTTIIIFLQAFIDFIKTLPENKNIESPDGDIFITDSLNIAALQSSYLFKTKPTGDKFRTYKFGYENDNPSYNYLRFRIFGEKGSGTVEETFYTLNLSKAKGYFTLQLEELYKIEGLNGLKDVYKKLTKRFLFNEYVIKDDFDVFVTFETMNNRGKKLSDLELLKNRLIYLTTLYSDEEVDTASRKNLRETINDTWKEVYHQLGRNKLRTLNDDDFLRAHWIMYFKYSRKTGQDYIHFLLNEHFTPKRIHRMIAREVPLEIQEEVRFEKDIEDITDYNGESANEVTNKTLVHLQSTQIRDFVNSLKESAVHWFNSFYPDLAKDMSDDERQWIDRLNRIGIGYFRPLVMAILKNIQIKEERISIFEKIERFIFIIFRMNSAMSNYGSSEFYNVVRAVDRGDVNLEEIVKKLDERLSYSFTETTTFRIDDFQNSLYKKFNGGSGYYDWSVLRYFLYEYETKLLSESRQKKFEWNDLLKTEKDKISIEHIYPQKETDTWAAFFIGIDEKHRRRYCSTLGNLILLSKSINSSLQNDSFDNKKIAKFDAEGKKIRNGYSDGSHSEIEVSINVSWGPEEIKARGIKLLKFMEERWDFRFKNDEEREKLLFLEIAKD